MVEILKTFDEFLFLKINGCYHPLADAFMIFFSKKLVWLPLYGVLIFLIVNEFKKNSIYILLTIAFMITFTDQFTSGLLKPLIERLRPCNEPHLQGLIHLVNDCGGNYGFVSSHAANSFAIAMFLYLLFDKNKFFGLLFLWAFIVSYSRVYLGVHYPGDVICGGFIGAVSGYMFYYGYSRIIYNKKLG